WIYGFAFLLGTFLFFFRSFLLKLRPGWLLHTHTLTKRLTVLACSDNTKDVRTPIRFRFLPHFTLMLDFFFLCQNIGWRYRRGAQFFAPPSEWRPRRPPVGKTAPDVHECSL